MTYPVLFRREYHGLPPPPGSNIPGPLELSRLCTKEHPDGYNMGIAYPPDAPVFWIKYGSSILWGEMQAQNFARQELQRSQSLVRVPAVFYACQLRIPPGYGEPEVDFYHKSYIVMEHVREKTAGNWLKEIDEYSEENSNSDTIDLIYSRFGLALTDICHIPAPEGSPPQDGGPIRHPLFKEFGAPRKCESVQQFEEHINKFLELTRRKQRVKDFTLEPRVFVYGDVWLENFILDDAFCISVVDFSESSFLPSGFMKYIVAPAYSKIRRDISALVDVPAVDGIDNISALCVLHGTMVMGSGSFMRLGDSMFGEETETEEMTYTDFVDERGDPITVPRMEPIVFDQTKIPRSSM